MHTMPVGAISAGLEPSSTRQLAKLVAEFKEKHESLAQDEIARFQFLCDSLFGTFTSRNKTGTGPDAIDWLPAVGNLDTGDSGWPPPPAAVQALTDRDAAQAEMVRYIGAESTPALADAVASFLVAHDFDLAASLPHLGVTVGCGTVNLFDAVCRDLIQHPLDTVLMPSMGYGFFLAQPYRTGGRVDVVSCDDSGEIAADDLAARIADCDARLYADWWPGRRRHVCAALRLAQQRGVLAVPEDEEALADLADRLAGDLGRDPVAARRRLEERIRDLSREQGADDADLHRDPRRSVSEIVRPPRVVAFLHINPGVTGVRYRREAVVRLGAVLAAAGVAAVEDFAYHSVRAPGSSLYSLQGLVPRCYTLFGLSKPFGLANIRVGLMLVAREDVKRIERLVENVVGFTPLVAQRTAVAALTADGDAARGYLDTASNDPADGYEARLRLFVVMLRGRTPGGSPGRTPAEQRIARLASDLLDAKRAAGIEVSGGPEHDAALVEDFLATGLSRWFTLPYEPECGFFAVVSCRPLLASGLLERLGLPRPQAFDVFAYLAYALGVRTIPEEGMAPTHPDTHLIRMAFSVTPRVLVESLFTIYLALRHLEQSHPTEAPS